MNFIVEKRLQWTEMGPKDKTPFRDPSMIINLFAIVDFLIFS